MDATGSTPVTQNKAMIKKFLIAMSIGGGLGFTYHLLLKAAGSQ